jgi:hypothetical protein
MRRVLAARAVTADSNRTPSPAAPQALAGPLPQLLRRGGVRSLSQPILDLDSGMPVAYEALARGPRGGAAAGPRRLTGRGARLNAVAAEAERSGAVLREDDALIGEWDVAVVGPHFVGAMVARDLGDIGEDGDRRFDFFVTYERELVVRAARALMARIVPAAGR